MYLRDYIQSTKQKPRLTFPCLFASVAACESDYFDQIDHCSATMQTRIQTKKRGCSGGTNPVAAPERRSVMNLARIDLKMGFLGAIVSSSADPESVCLRSGSVKQAPAGEIELETI